MNEKDKSKKYKIRTYFTIWTLISALASILVVVIIFFILNLNIDIAEFMNNHTFVTTGILLVVPLVIGTVITILIGNPVLKIMKNLSKAINEISNGNYKVRLPETNPLKELNQNFNKMVSELDSVEILRDDFVNNFSHEFKTPIVSIKGFAEELKRNDLTEEERIKYLDIIIEESNRLAELSTNILNLSKIEKQTILTDKVKVNIGEQMRKVILVEMKKIEHKNIELNLEIDDVNAIVNEGLMEQVWINIIENAIKYSNQNGILDISVKNNGEEIIVKIKDNGIGIEEEELEHIFNKFYKIDKSASSPGNGLGLALAKKIVDLHEGKIEVKSKINEGTEFTIELKKQM